MSGSAVADARGKVHALLARLEDWVRGDIVGSGSRSLRGTAASVTEANLWCMAQVAYMRELYGMD
jgi:hypothetical protein